MDKHDKQAAHGGFEREDLGVAGVVYALIGLAVFCLVVHFLVTGLYGVLERFSDTQGANAPMSPLITDVPTDTRHVAKDYPQAKFPNPKLEEDELGQFKSILAAQEETLNSYGWVDQQAGVAHIPIDQAMKLLAQRGMPVNAEAAAPHTAAVSSGTSGKKGKK